MKKILFLILIILFIPISIYAQISIEYSLNETSVTTKKEDAVLYNFSNDLLSATYKCTPYKEDFTKNNPHLSNLGKMFGTDFQVHIDIKGIKNNKCEFTVTQKFLGFGGTEYICTIDEQAQNLIIDAMKSKSTELLTETFTTKTMMMEENGDITDYGESKKTMTDTLFNITLSKILGNHCIIKEVIPSEEEKNIAEEKSFQFSNEFISALQTCSPYSDDKDNVVKFSDIKIIGNKNVYCHVRSENFDFFIPNEKLKEITNLKKLHDLIYDKNTAKYRVLENYSLSNIYKTIEDCNKKNNFSFSHNSSFEDYYNIDRSISVEYKNNECLLKILNKLTIKNEITDYSIECKISDEEYNKIITDYKPKNNNYYEQGKNILKKLIKNKSCKLIDKNIKR